MTKYEAFETNQFEKVEFVDRAIGAQSGKIWLLGFITHRRFPHELPITEDFQAEWSTVIRKEFAKVLLKLRGIS